MQHEMSTAAKTNWAVAAVVALAAYGVFAPQTWSDKAWADGIGAPTSAAGGVSAPSSPSLPSAAGPLGSSGSMSGSSSGTRSFDDSSSTRSPSLSPGTGKFEGPNNGSRTPCLGSTGFGSSGGVPGRKC